jgi:hypothetical protein
MFGSMVAMLLVVIATVSVVCILVFGTYVRYYPSLQSHVGVRQTIKGNEEKTHEDSERHS